MNRIDHDSLSVHQLLRVAIRLYYVIVRRLGSSLYVEDAIHALITHPEFMQDGEYLPEFHVYMDVGYYVLYCCYIFIG